MPTRREMLLTAVGTVAIAGCIGERRDPSPDHRTVSVENRHNESMDIEISIKDVHDENVVHTETYHLDSGEEKLVYDTSTDDLGATMLEVTARTNETKITELNSGCDGKLPVVIESDGSLDAANSVC